MSLEPLPGRRFIRKTQLAPNEYRKNFHQIDREILTAVTSTEADQVTPLMSKIYLRLVNAPDKFWEREGVLRVEAEVRDEKLVKAWDVLCEMVGVASATASKALRWMHEQGVVGYFAGKNGVGIRVFINRAASSIGTRPAGKKILEFTHASSRRDRASSDEAGFNDSFADSETSETDLNPRAPKGGAETNKEVRPHPIQPGYSTPHIITAPAPPTEEIVERLLRELVPSVESAATRAAAREHERTREWLESRGLPKAARVAQREAYNVLRQYGLVGAAKPARPDVMAEQTDPAPALARPLSAEEVRELAETCVAMLEVHGQAIDVTLSELSAEAGGGLLAEDAPQVRELAEALAYGGERKG